MSFNIKLVTAGIIGVIILSIIPLLNIPTLETNTAFISAYGAYLGGTLSPFISALAFIALLKNILQQQVQINNQTKKNKKSGLLATIDRLESDIEHT